jgi:RimJ/RimL family protein N-acetyltransferase
VVELTGQRVVLRTLTLDDVEILAEDDAHRGRLRKQAERSPTLDDGGFLALVVVADGAVVGDIQARAPEYAFLPGTCEIGITLLPDARGRGFGLAAVNLFTDYLRRDGMGRVQASTPVDNVAMRTVLERAGYEFEGVLRSYGPGDSGREDYAMYSAISDVPALRVVSQPDDRQPSH